MIELYTERTFRQTPGVHFADIGIPGSNGTDIVEHSGPSISPPNNRFGLPQWYVHRYQTDFNRVLRGHRLFELFNPGWDHSHWFVMLDSKSGALRIPPGCYHRSYSGNDGSLLINQAIRVEGYDENTEFIPQTIIRPFVVKPCYNGCDAATAQMFIQAGEFST